MRLIPKRWGRALAAYLAAPRHVHQANLVTPVAQLAACLQVADVVLVEGHSRFSVAIKYLTQSTWSHAAVYVGQLVFGADPQPRHCFVEADAVDGVRMVGLAAFAEFHTRICRPVGLDEAARARIVAFLLGQVGQQYDMRNVIDLARYLLPTPPVPVRFRRKMLSLGSGDPTQAICSTLVARAFETVHYPILPMAAPDGSAHVDCPDCVAAVFHARDSSLLVPRDFDVSPYFQVVKPSLVGGFDYKALIWA